MIKCCCSSLCDLLQINFSVITVFNFGELEEIKLSLLKETTTSDLFVLFTSIFVIGIKVTSRGG